MFFTKLFEKICTKKRVGDISERFHIVGMGYPKILHVVTLVSI